MISAFVSRLLKNTKDKFSGDGSNSKGLFPFIDTCISNDLGEEESCQLTYVSLVRLSMLYCPASQ